MQKQLEGTQKYINVSVDRVAHIDGQLMYYCEQYTRFQRSINASVINHKSIYECFANMF